MADTTETTTLVYIGRWGQAGSKALAYGWVEATDLDAEPMVFSKVKGSAIGGLYTVRVIRAEGHIISAYAQVHYTGQLDDPDRIARWQANDIATRRQDSLRRMENRHARESREFDAACKPLLDMARTCRTVDEVTVIVAAVRARMVEAWVKK